MRVHVALIVAWGSVAVVREHLLHVEEAAGRLLLADVFAHRHRFLGLFDARVEDLGFTYGHVGTTSFRPVRRVEGWRRERYGGGLRDGRSRADRDDDW